MTATLPRLTASDAALLKAGAAKVGITAEQLDSLVAACSTGTGSDVQIDGLTNGVKIRLTGDRVTPELAWAFDENVSSFGVGWEVKQQERTARFDFRDLLAYDRPFVMRWAPYLTALPTRLAINVLVADLAWCGGQGRVIEALNVGGMLVSAEQFDRRGRIYSAAAKAETLDYEQPDIFKEIHVLSGCRFPDAESLILTSDELRTFCPADVTLPEPMRSLYWSEGLKQRFRPEEVGTLEDYVNSLKWKTPGGASMSGYTSLGVSSEEASGVIRLTKAVLPFVASFEELVAAVSNLANIKDVIVKAIIKLGETSKNRIIFPYAVAPTIAKSYLLEHIRGGGNYPQNDVPPINREWSTSLGHSGWSEIVRHLRTLSTVDTAAAAKAFMAAEPVFAFMLADTGEQLDRGVILKGSGELASLAADVKGFDHQVGIDAANEFWLAVKEVVPAASWRRVTRATASPYGELVVPPDQADEYIATPGRRELERVADFDALISRTRAKLVKNIGVLTSGTPETSKIGNRASYIVCSVCCRLLHRVSPNCVDMFDVRGDDQLVTLRGRNRSHALALAKLWWIAASAYFELSPEKSKISIGETRVTEFLRIEYSKRGARGYLNRALVWFSEMRPLSNEPVLAWASKPVEAIPRAFTCVRRGASDRLLQLAEFVARRALSRLGIDQDYISAPTGCGGLGLGDPLCVSFSTRSAGGAVVDIRSDWASELASVEFAALGATPREINTIVQRRADALALTSEDPSIRSTFYLSRPVRRDISSPKVVSLPIPPLRELVLNVPAARFGENPGILVEFTRATELARARSVSAYSLLSKPTQEQVRRIEKRYKFPRAIAVDWCAGKLPGNQSFMHPELSFIAVRLAASAISLFARSAVPWDAHSAYFAVAHVLYSVSVELQHSMSLLYSW